MPDRENQTSIMYDPTCDDTYSSISFIHSNIKKTENIEVQSLSLRET